jgi:small multidrug resistance family-3 protein
MTTALVYIQAAFAEIAGCFSFWAWLRLDKSPIWLAPGMISLAAFAWLLTRAVYISASLVWLWAVEGTRPDRWDFLGAAVCFAAAGIILLGPRNLAA